jgi:hypothetical protein
MEEPFLFYVRTRPQSFSLPASDLEPEPSTESISISDESSSAVSETEASSGTLVAVLERRLAGRPRRPGVIYCGQNAKLELPVSINWDFSPPPNSLHTSRDESQNVLIRNQKSPSAIAWVFSTISTSELASKPSSDGRAGLVFRFTARWISLFSFWTSEFSLPSKQSLEDGRRRRRAMVTASACSVLSLFACTHPAYEIPLRPRPGEEILLRVAPKSARESVGSPHRSSLLGATERGREKRI